MATGITQKNYKLLFPLWSLKKDIMKIIKLCRRKIESIGKNLDPETEKKLKTKLYFHCGPLKKDILKIIKSCRRKIESIRKNLDIETEKKLKLYLSCFA